MNSFSNLYVKLASNIEKLDNDFYRLSFYNIDGNIYHKIYDEYGLSLHEISNLTVIGD